MVDIEQIRHKKRSLPIGTVDEQSDRRLERRRIAERADPVNAQRGGRRTHAALEIQPRRMNSQRVKIVDPSGNALLV
ncbi:MAG TPA: hypothetical protein VGN07_22895 [Steroidobacteraceae bacterium]